MTLTAIERYFRERDEWIVIGVRPDADIMADIVSNLYSAVPALTKFIDANLNLSAFGIGLNLSKKSPATSMDYVLGKNKNCKIYSLLYERQISILSHLIFSLISVLLILSFISL